MDLKRLRTFVAVAEHGTVSRAAQVLHITQPALSRQISALESELGFELYRRSGRRLLLTTRGEQLLGDCRSLLTHAGILNERVHALRRGDIKVLKVAGSALTIEGLFPTFLPRHAASAPDVRLSLIEADAARHLDMLERGEVHLALNVVDNLQLDENRFGSYLLPRFQVLAACATGGQVEPGDAIDIRRLVQHPLLLMDTSFATRNIFDAACQLAGVRPSALVESASAHALMDFAEAGHGVAVIPSILRTDRRRLRIMRVTHRREPLRISLAVLWDKKRTLLRHAEAFSELMAQHIREAFSVGTSAKARSAAAAKASRAGKSRKR